MKGESVRLFIRALLLATIVSVSVLSCRKENAIPPIPGQEPEPSYKIIEGSYQTYRNCDFEQIISAYAPDFSLPDGVNIHTLVSVIRSLKLEKRLKIRNLDHVLEVLLMVAYKTAFPDVFIEDYDKYLSREVIDAGVVDILLNRRYPQSKVSAIISQACNPDGCDKYTRADRILSPEAIKRGSEINNQIMECGRRCDLTEGWTISTPVRFFYGADDEVVSLRAVLKAKKNLSSSAV